MEESKTTSTRLREVSELGADERESLFALMVKCYRGVERQQFEHDLSEKQWVIVVSDGDGVVRGFSTQMLFQSRDYLDTEVLFSGDTIVDPSWWNQHDLSGVWGQLALSLIDRQTQSDRKLFWFLISKGYKTYRYLPLFFHQFFPRFDESTPAFYQHLMRSLGQQKFGNRFDHERGIVRAAPGDYSLRAHVAPLVPQRLNSPHVRFFATKNPGYAVGDELCCLAPLTRENFTPAAYRVIEAANGAMGSLR